jgi:hypothetical protein
MNIVMITTYRRPLLFQQTVASLLNNAADRKSHHLTVVFDLQDEHDETPPMYNDVSIVLTKYGASRARNIGAGSVPRYRRQEHVLFLDDDVYMAKGWDEILMKAESGLPHKTVLSGYGHPFNIEEPRGYAFAKFPLLISSVAMMMRWEAFDQIGPWDEPGGPGGSEDYAISVRATAKGYYLAVCDPHCVIHTGLTSSGGIPIVGADLLKEQNTLLERRYGIEGRVIYG